MTDTINDIPAKFHPGEGLSERELIKNLNLRDLRSIFYICPIGLSASVLVLICETIFSIQINKFYDNLNYYIQLFLLFNIRKLYKFVYC